jgi:GTPase
MTPEAVVPGLPGGDVIVDITYFTEDGDRHTTRVRGEIAIVAVSRRAPGGSMPEVVVRGEATIPHISATVAGILGTLEKDCGNEAVRVAWEMFRHELTHLGPPKEADGS